MDMNGMTLSEAYKILGINSSATKKEVNAAFRKLSRTHHPDVNNGDDKMFKKINAAKQIIDNPPQNTSFSGNSGFGGFGRINLDDFFTQHINMDSNNRVTYPTRNLTINKKISFKESILGTTLKITFDKNKACSDCNGNPYKETHNGCNYCNGFGQTIKHFNNMTGVMNCTYCKGPNITNCSKCSGNGMETSNVTLDVKVPGGVKDGTTLLLRGAGDLKANINGNVIYDNVRLIFSIEKEEELRLIDSDVHSSLNISLLMALKGTTASVKTVLGEKEITIHPCFKNKNTVEIPGCGVNKIGKQIVTIFVDYPDYNEKLINYLENNCE